MRIELNAGGLNAFSILKFSDCADRFEKSVDTMKNGFENIRASIYNMNGGIGILQDAFDLIGKRMDHDEQQRQQVHTAREKCVEFLENVKSTDRDVARLVRQETKEFCKKYPRLAPPPPEREKSLWDKCKEYVGGAIEWGKGVIKGVIDWGISKGKEIYNFVMDTAAEAVNWLIEKGKNLYEGIKIVFTAIGEMIETIIDVSVEFIANLVVNIVETLQDLAEFVIDLAVDIGETLIDIAVAIKDFVCEHIWDIVDTVIGFVETVVGVANVILAIGEVVASGGALTPLAALQIAGGAVQALKGWDKMWGGICNMTGFEPEGAAKWFLRPTTSFETMLNDALPGWHLGDLAGLIGDGITIASDISNIIKEAPKITILFVDNAENLTLVTGMVFKVSDVAKVASNIGQALLNFTSQFTDWEFDDNLADGWGRINSIVGLKK